MRHLIIIISLILTACTIDAQDPGTTGARAEDPTSTQDNAPRGGSTHNVGEPPAPVVPVGSPMPPRFEVDGLHVIDRQTGLVWFAADAAYPYNDPDVDRMCRSMGYRVASSEQVRGLGGPLPPEFHAVYAWAEPSFFPNNERPIITLDGCVDVRNGTDFHGDCVIPGIPKVSRSAMCILY